jgi:hypothetical protein
MTVVAATSSLPRDKMDLLLPSLPRDKMDKFLVLVIFDQILNIRNVEANDLYYEIL